MGALLPGLQGRGKMKPFAWSMVVATIVLAWFFWFMPAKPQMTPMLLHKSGKGMHETVPQDIKAKASSWLDLLGKCAPIVSTGLAVATFRQNRKRKR